MELQRRSGRHIVDDLHHGAAFVAAVNAREVGKHGIGGRQIARGYVRRGATEVVEAVREDADRDPGAIDAVGCPGHVRPLGSVALAGDRPRVG